MKNVYRMLLFLGIWLLFHAFLFAQSGRVTGKLEGIITDSQSGEALIGANVVLVGTYMGATTDEDGYFVVLNIPAGTYEVEVSYLGYHTKKALDVIVSPNQTTRLDVELSPEAIEGEAVVVVAEKPVIQRDQTANVVELSAADIKRKPVTNFVGIIRQQAGAVTTAGASGGLHIRGGRANELVYFIDGVNTNDPAYNTRGTSVDVNAIEQLKILSGGFEAEYGEAMSGVVQIVTKSGPKDKYQLYLESQSNDFLEGSRYDNGYNKNVINLGGPVPLTNRTTTFFGSAVIENVAVDDPSPVADIRRDSRHSPGFTFKIQNTSLKNFRVFLSGNYNYSKWYNYDHNRSKGVWLNFTPENQRESFLLSTSITHTLSKKFFYDLTISQFFTGRKLYGEDGRNYQDFRIVNTFTPWVAEHAVTPSRLNPDFDMEWYRWQNGWSEEQAWLDYYFNLGYFTYDENGNPDWTTPEQMADAFNNRYWDTGYYRVVGDTVEYVPFEISKYKLFLQDRIKYSDYAYEGDVLWARFPEDKFGYFQYGFIPWWHERSTRYYSAEGAFQGQLNRNNYIKIGGFGRWSVLKYTDIQFLNLNPYFDHYTKKPTNAAVYIQDKIEYEDMVINLGVRYDYFHPHSQVLKDFNNVEAGYRQADPKEQISPRFGIAFAVSDRTVMRANYGHFFQAPDLGEIYQSIEADFTSGVPLIGNPDLPHQKEIMYAVALKHRLSRDISIEVNSYYKDIKNLLSTRQETTFWQGRPAQYTIFKIDDFAKVKGIDIIIEKRPSRFFFGTLTYSFMDAKGTGSSAREFYYRYALSGGGELPRKEYPLEFDITHTIKLDLNLYLPPQWGPRLMGFRPLQDLSANVFYNYYSGPPYTPSDLKGNPGELGSKRMPSVSRADMRIEKFIRLGDSFRMSLFMDMLNLFNTLNVVNVHLATGKPDDNGYRPLFEESQYAAQAQIWGYPSAQAYYDDLVKTWREYVNRPNYYDIPRIIRFGVSAQVEL